MNPMVLEAVPMEGFHLRLRFNTGEERVFDVGPYLNRGAFGRLRDLHLFSQLQVAYGTVVWPGELDIAPETLYLRSIPADSIPSP